MNLNLINILVFISNGISKDFITQKNGDVSIWGGAPVTNNILQKPRNKSKAEFKINKLRILFKNAFCELSAK